LASLLAGLSRPRWARILEHAHGLERQSADHLGAEFEMIVIAAASMACLTSPSLGWADSLSLPATASRKPERRARGIKRGDRTSVRLARASRQRLAKEAQSLSDDEAALQR
jgi:hypothetical protein